MSKPTAIQESTRYDRQIRVWGAEAQSRLQNAKVLLINFTNLNVEVAKNLVLAGVSVTIADDRIVSEKDLANNFFLSMDDIGKPITEAVAARVQELNSFTTVNTIPSGADALTEAQLQAFDVILLSGGSSVQGTRIANAGRAREGGVVFWGDASGDDAIFFADFGPSFQYFPDPQATASANSDSNAPAKPKAELQQEHFPPLTAVISASWQSIPSRLQPLSKTFVLTRLVQEYRALAQQEVGPNTEVETLLQVLLSILNSQQPSVSLEQLTALLPEANSTNSSNSSTSSASDAITTFWSETLQRVVAQQQVGSILAVSMLGSFLSQEVIKAISRTGKPANNVWTYDGSSMMVRAFPVART